MDLSKYAEAALTGVREAHQAERLVNPKLPEEPPGGDYLLASHLLARRALDHCDTLRKRPPVAEVPKELSSVLCLILEDVCRDKKACQAIEKWLGMPRRTWDLASTRRPWLDCVTQRTLQAYPVAAPVREPRPQRTRKGKGKRS
ncbi:MAG: hypothetical protein KC492_25640 [Myxococcales bacterium]|nr:hypothetical protein [Myxococcales bacterium]